MPPAGITVGAASRGVEPELAPARSRRTRWQRRPQARRCAPVNQRRLQRRRGRGRGRAISGSAQVEETTDAAKEKVDAVGEKLGVDAPPVSMEAIDEAAELTKGKVAGPRRTAVKAAVGPARRKSTAPTVARRSKTARRSGPRRASRLVQYKEDEDQARSRGAAAAQAPDPLLLKGSLTWSPRSSSRTKVPPFDSVVAYGPARRTRWASLARPPLPSARRWRRRIEVAQKTALIVSERRASHSFEALRPRKSTAVAPRADAAEQQQKPGRAPCEINAPQPQRACLDSAAHA